jgi:carbamoyl-phosphate synthase small subunit
LVCKILVLIIRPDASESLEVYFKTKFVFDVDTRALVNYIRDNGAMNAVICTDGTSVDDLKLAFYRKFLT